MSIKIQVTTFSGKRKDWPCWRVKFLAQGRVMKFTSMLKYILIDHQFLIHEKYQLKTLDETILVFLIFQFLVLSCSQKHTNLDSLFESTEYSPIKTARRQ